MSFFFFFRPELTDDTALEFHSSMGSVISLHHLQRIDDMVKRATNAGSKILAGGERLFGRSEIGDFSFSNGAFYPPTVVADVTIEDEIWKEEVFGPVVVVKRFSVSAL